MLPKRYMVKRMKMTENFLLDILWKSLVKKFGNPDRKVSIDCSSWFRFWGLRHGLNKDQSRKLAELFIRQGFTIQMVPHGWVLMPQKNEEDTN